MVATMRSGRSVRAKLLIGADGNRSACRRYIQVRSHAQHASQDTVACMFKALFPPAGAASSCVYTLLVIGSYAPVSTVSRFTALSPCTMAQIPTRHRILASQTH